jgi:hypothetical protein
LYFKQAMVGWSSSFSSYLRLMGFAWIILGRWIEHRALASWSPLRAFTFTFT